MAPDDIRRKTAVWFNSSGLTLLMEIFLAFAVLAMGLAGWLVISSTPYLFLLAWLMLWLRGEGWHTVGLRQPVRVSHAVIVGIFGGLAFQLISLYLIEPLVAQFTGDYPDISMFRPLVGNAGYLVLSLLATWTIAAFGEEMVFRGYLMERIARLAGLTRTGWVIGLIATSILFGVAHLYQGLSGVIVTGMTGMVFGVFYIITGRNLWAAILAHGVYDTVGFLMIYFGVYPGM